MMLPRLIGLAAVAVVCLAGCCKHDVFEVRAGAPEQCVGNMVFPDDTLSFSVCSTTGKPPPEWHDYWHPIRSVRIFVDGAPTELPVNVTDRWGKDGWHQNASFVAPAGAKTVTAVATLQHMDKLYHVTVPYELTNYHFPKAYEKWRSGEIQIVELDEKPLHR